VVAARHLRPLGLVVREIGKEAPLHPAGAAVDIFRLLLTIATDSAGGLRVALPPPIGTNTITRLLLVDQDITTTIVDLLLCAIAGGEAVLLLPIIVKEEEFLPVGGNAIEVTRTA